MPVDTHYLRKAALVGTIFGLVGIVLKTLVPILIYQPRPISRGNHNLLPLGNGDGYLFLPACDISALWVVFGGNAMVSLDWIPWIISISHPGTAILLIEYPGYGNASGPTSSKTIAESSSNTFKLALAHLPRKLPSVTAFGHSIGAAVALKFAITHSVDKLVLSAPFTSLSALASHFLPFIPQFILRVVCQNHEWNNVLNLRSFLLRRPFTRVHIIHGINDAIVPFTMGKELSRLGPAITFHKCSSGHNDILNRETSLYSDVLN